MLGIELAALSGSPFGLQFSLVPSEGGFWRPAGFRFADQVAVFPETGAGERILAAELAVQCPLWEHPAESWWARQLVSAFIAHIPSPVFQTLAREAAEAEVPTWLRPGCLQEFSDAGVRLESRRPEPGHVLLRLESLEAQRCKNCQALNQKELSQCHRCQAALKRKLWSRFFSS